MLCTIPSEQPAVECAQRILAAWNEGHDAKLEAELGRAAMLRPDGLGSFEMERIELLASIVQSLNSKAASHDQVRGALLLLQHLANGCALPSHA